MFTLVLNVACIYSLRGQLSIALTEEAEWMGYFNEQKAKATALQHQIDATDKRIDALVYELYGLTEEEVSNE